jgi:predicted acyl esterase
MQDNAASRRQGSAAGYDVVIERDVLVPMRDGVRLATDLYFPMHAGTRVGRLLPRHPRTHAV